MAIGDIAGYSHLTASDIESLGDELDAIRRDVEESLGERDAQYIHAVIRFHRVLDVGSRIAIVLSPSKAGRWLGVAGLATAKCLENMELGHNIGHGQWDWMNDPEIHSSTWEWDMVGLSEQWRYAHNYRHHIFTNVLGMDDDIGFSVMRVTRDQPWHWRYLLQPVQSVLLAVTFEWAIALYDLDAAFNRAESIERRSEATAGFARKIRRQVVKDYVVFPVLAGRRRRPVLKAMLLANLLRNLWTYAVIICGHFPDGAEKFTLESVGEETRGEWYLRQMLGSANFNAGRGLALASGNLCYQIEHHLFPDLPSNRYAEIAPRVRELCAKYDLPYTTGPLARQVVLAQRTIFKMSVPNCFLSATADDAPETGSERRFEGVRYSPRGRGGLGTALRRLRHQRDMVRRSL